MNLLFIVTEIILAHRCDGEEKKVKLSLSLSLKRAKEKRSHELMYKTNTKMEDWQLLLSQSWKSNNYIGSNSKKKSNIAIAILDNF